MAKRAGRKPPKWRRLRRKRSKKVRRYYGRRGRYGRYRRGRYGRYRRFRGRSWRRKRRRPYYRHWRRGWQQRRRRRKIFRRPTTRYALKFFYRLPKFFRMRFFIFFARLASLLARRYLSVPVFFRLNFVGYVGTIDFYLNYITTKLYYRYILNDVIKPIVRLSTKYYRGFRIICNGRFTRAQMATSRVYRRGSLRSNMVSIPLGYGQRSVILKYGVCNLKIWLRY
jgi:hypothetical protein